MAKTQRDVLACSSTIAATVATSAAALPKYEVYLADLQRFLRDEVASKADATLLKLGHALCEAAKAYVATDTRFEGDGSPKADRACAKSWAKCEEIVEEIIAVPAVTFDGIRIKAHAAAWIESDMKDKLRDGIVADLLSSKDSAASSRLTGGPPSQGARAAIAGDTAANKLELESELMDASMFGHLAYNAFCQMGFESREPPKLTEDESALIYWTVSQLSWRIDEAKRAFYGEDETSS